MGRALKPLRAQPSKINKSTILSRLQKRLVQMERKYTSLQNERDLLAERNKESTVSLANQKVENAALRKEIFLLQRHCHENTIKANSHKVKLAEIERILRNSFMEIESSIPHIAQITSRLCNNKTAIQNVLCLTRSSENEYSGQGHHQSSVNINEDFNRSSEKRMKQRVGPMVRGLLITKPKIMLERIMLPQPQERMNDSIDISAVEENNQLNPIQEENENDEGLRLRHVSVRPKTKLGSSWKRKRQEHLAKEREQGNKSLPTPAVSYDADSSDSENNAPAMNLEPVLRLKDVRRLLQNSTLVKVDASCSGDGSRGGGKFNRQSENEACRHVRGMRANEDPMEGSSWMFTNRCSFERPTQVNRRSSLLKSDSSNDDEDEEVVPQNISSASLMNTLVGPNNNQTFTVGPPSPNLITESPTNSASPVAEPDSTMNVDENNCGSPLLLPPDQPPSRSSSPQHQERLHSLPSFTEPFSSLANSTSLSTSKNSLQKTKSCSNSESTHTLQSPVSAEGKRVRKPKVHLYPGEENVEKTKRKSTKPSKASNSRKSSATSNKPSKKIVGCNKSKKSLATPRTSENSTLRSSCSDSEDTRSRRNKKTISYKECSLNVKQRRP